MIEPKVRVYTFSQKLTAVLVSAWFAVFSLASFAQTTVIGGGGTATSVSPAAFPLLGPNGTSSAPSYSFASNPNTGIYRPTTNTIGFSAGGGGVVFVESSGLTLDRTVPFMWTDASGLGGSRDLFLYRDAANTLAQRNSTNAQTFRVYNTFTDASNYERGFVRWNSNVFQVGAEQAGTGVARPLQIDSAPGSGVIDFSQGGASFWRFNLGIGSRSFVPLTTNAQDIGDTTPLRVRTVYLATSTQGANSKALVDGTNTEFVRVAIPQTMGSNYAAGQLIYTVYARDATTGTQALHGIAEWSCINNAGTESCSTIIESQKTAAVVTGGTLTCALTHVTGLTDLIGIQANCDSSLTVTSMTIEYRLDLPHPNTVTPQ